MVAEQSDAAGANMNRLAESMIDEVLRGVLGERRQAVERARATAAAARHDLESAQREVLAADNNLVAAERDLRRWRIHREFGYETGIKALQAAQVADFVPSAVPPGTHRRAVTGYLQVHHPVWRISPAGGPIRRVAEAAGDGIRRALSHRRPPHRN